MHQPSYVDPTNGETLLPWVRLHGVKDYTDMAVAVAEVPEARVSFNWVPGLWDQIDTLSEASHPNERFWRLTLKPAGALDAHERAFICERFFSLEPRTMLEPYARYKALRDAVAAGIPLDTQGLRDLQVWFNLAWCGTEAARHPVIAELLQRGGDFDEADKSALLDAQRSIVAELQPRYQALVDAGQVELTATPYYHPILPLLMDSDLARAADPASPLPAARFRWPGDARAHVRRATTAHTARFGIAPRGMWPAEGSVAEETLHLYSDSDVRWILSDEAILEKSLGRHDLSAVERHRPWRRGDLAIFFRDHGLSDRIGFVYQGWQHEAAYADFVHHLVNIRDAVVADGGGDSVVTIALDGENCWEHYTGGSLGFLPGLYRAIAETDGMRLSTFEDALKAVEPAPLDSLAAGSWIDGTFRTWLGDPVKNRAWELLTQTRDAVGRPLDAIERDDPALADLILRAEASDWWWWFGDGHSSSFDGTFDALFRAHLVAIYDRLGAPVPEALRRPIGTDTTHRTEPAPGVTARSRPASQPPIRQLSPEIDGRTDDFYRWRGAGRVALSFGAIHRAQSALEQLYYANDAEALTLRLVARDAAESLDGLSVHLETERAGNTLSIQLHPALASTDGVVSHAAHVLDARVPLATLGVPSQTAVLPARIVLTDPTKGVLERLPPSGWADLQLLGSHTQPDRDDVTPSEMRLDPLKQRWTVIAPGRGDRPSDFVPPAAKQQSAPCPFCAVIDGTAPGHRILERVVGRDRVIVLANRYPAYRVETALERTAVGPYDRVSGVGAHEVVVETHRHDQPFHLLGVAQITATLRVWRDRLGDLLGDRRLHHLIAFKNTGPSSGASLSHPHSQIVAAPVASQQLTTELTSARSHYEQHLRCLSCDILAYELDHSARVIEVGERFVAFCPYASRHPFEVAIYPRRHEAMFSDLSDSDVGALGALLSRTLQRLVRSVGVADYNLTVQTGPNPDSFGLPRGRLDGLGAWWHWRLEIVPRIQPYGGYEVGTGVHMNSTAPDAAAAHLRSLA
ncbi:MAG: alpha-amylase/alpha-mannosidase (GH57 family)/galactose-1-phosphate uridylyltransferase [Myxococcota bacterium]|jgi:alpha-amylase/alpha-mannosidase (GH57 family)/galactose-1-phosphate uridylyltransferase